MIHISFDKEKGKKEEKKKDTEISQQVDITGRGGGESFFVVVVEIEVISMY